MSESVQPPDPSSVERRVQRNQDRRQRSRRTLIRITVVLIGFVIGISVGLLYTWKLNPVIQTNVAPWQLDTAGQTQWVIAISVAWAHDGDLVKAANRLNDLHWGDQTFQRVADTACTLIQSNYAQSATGLRAIRSMVDLAQGQGKTSCAATMLSGLNTPTALPTVTVIAATPTLAPPPTKTPFVASGPTFTPNAPILPSATIATGDFKVARIEPYCSSTARGLLEVFIQQTDGKGIPGIAIRASAPSGTDRFFTGLEPERDPGYADFQMQAGQTYTITIEGSGTSSSALIAANCTVQGGATSVTSYRIYFRRVTAS